MENAHRHTTLHNTLVVFNGTRYHMSTTIFNFRDSMFMESTQAIHWNVFDKRM